MMPAWEAGHCAATGAWLRGHYDGRVVQEEISSLRPALHSYIDRWPETGARLMPERTFDAPG